MKVFFDEDVPRKLERFLTQHEIQTVVSMEWGGVKNGALLVLIEREGFQVFLAGDKNMETQQRLQARPHVHGIAAALVPRGPMQSRRLIAACSNRVRKPAC